jgi:hypothetical protein
MVSYVKSELKYSYRFLPLLNMNRVPWSVTVYFKNVFCQYNLTSQIETVQDKSRLLRTGQYDFVS